MNEKLIAALRNDAESANADYSTPLTLGNHLDAAAADALEMTDAKLHEQDLRIADLVAHLNAEQTKVARLAAKIERLKAENCNIRENSGVRLKDYESTGLEPEETQDFMVAKGEKTEMLDDIADRLLELAEAKKDGRAPVPQWVSVDDRLPLKVRINGEPVYYLCKHASWGCVFVGCFLSKSHGTVWAQQIFHEDSNRRFSVSHWMEIPEPPKEER